MCIYIYFANYTSILLDIASFQRLRRIFVDIVVSRESRHKSVTSRLTLFQGIRTQKVKRSRVGS